MELVADHDDLRSKMREFAQTMAMDSPDMDDVMRRRIAFSRAFRHHMAHEELAVSQLRTRTCPAARGAAREHGAMIRALFLRYSDHVKQWTPAELARDWAGYCSAVLTLQDRLYDLMEWEEDNLFRLLDQPARHAA